MIREQVKITKSHQKLIKNNDFKMYFTSIPVKVALQSWAQMIRSSAWTGNSGSCSWSGEVASGPGSQAVPSHQS
jgi:hypothetical protein